MGFCNSVELEFYSPVSPVNIDERERYSLQLRFINAQPDYEEPRWFVDITAGISTVRGGCSPMNVELWWLVPATYSSGLDPDTDCSDSFFCFPQT